LSGDAPPYYDCLARPFNIMRQTRKELMARLARQVATCAFCPELVENRTVPVFGEGKLGARVLLVDESPGH